MKYFFFKNFIKITQAPKYAVDIAELDTVSPVKPFGVFHYFKPVQNKSWDWESLPSINEKLIPSPGCSLANSKVRKKKKATEK